MYYCPMQLNIGEAFKETLHAPVLFTAPIDIEVGDKIDLNMEAPRDSRYRVIKIVRGRRIIYKHSSRGDWITVEHSLPEFWKLYHLDLALTKR